ncbi:MFS general substrate transporter [Mycena sanguinolenta]|uniref:MFS general substrate transporter n=1 Tax=Mycena sanguinolenta TaxID=230812 RepID=A0A8H6XJK3_9AGAR|nr:MFS general substrate transporter [Mycena sanguinolenta]
MSSSSVDKHNDEKQEAVDVSVVEVSVADVDTGAVLACGVDVDLDPDEAVRIRKKIDRHILPLMCVLYWVQFMDKTTLGNAAVLGIKQGAHLTTDQYNWLGTIFYISYLALEFPQNLALQHFPVAKYISINVFIWAICVCAHAACHNFAGLMAVRFILGACEGVTTAGFLIITAMFYTRKEQTVRVGYWFFMNGFAQIISGFLSYGILHIKPGKLEPWRWLMIITGIMTFITAVCFWFFFPDSPTTAWFLTPEERVKAVLRIKQNQTGVENKHFKKEQLIEALTDPKTWLFALYAVFTQIPNSFQRRTSLSNQKPLIVNSFGFTVLQTTLLTCVDGVISIATVGIGVNVAAWTGQRGFTAFAWKCPDVLGGILIQTLPWSNKVGLLFSLWVAGLGSTAFVIVIAWLGSVTAGHTKRITTNTIMLMAYVMRRKRDRARHVEGMYPPAYLASRCSPLPQDKYKPRNRVPWIVCIVSFVVCMALLLIIRGYLAAENRRRDAESPSQAYDNVYIEHLSWDGKLEKVKVDKEFLDLTDIQNRDFRYVL